MSDVIKPDQEVISLSQELQRICKKYNAGIYPGYIDDKDEELGVVLRVGDRFYSLESADGNHIKLDYIS